MKSGGQRESLAETLLAAADRLEECVPLVSAHKSDDDVRHAVAQCARFLVQILQHFPKIRKEYGVHAANV